MRVRCEGDGQKRLAVTRAAGGEKAKPMSPPATGRSGKGGAVLWSVLMAAGRRATTTVVTFVLAGLLGPDAFGTVALATIFVYLVQLLFQQGLAPALIRQTVLSTRSADIVLRLALVGSTVAAAATVLLAPAAGRLFGDPHVVDVLRVLALSLPLQAVFMVQEALLRRESDFRTLALRTNASILLGGVAGVVTAVLGAGVWALVVQQFVTSGTGTIALWTAPGAWRPAWRPTGWWRDAETRELLRFSTRTSAASAAQFLQTQLDSLLAGVFFGVTAVGLYRLAARLVENVLDLGARSVQLTVLPDLARQTTAERVRERVLVNHRTICSLALPPLGVLAGSSGALVAVLGQEWEVAATPVALLALAAVGTAGTTVVTPALQASGRAGLLVGVSGGSAVVSLVLLFSVGLLGRDLALPDQVLALAGARLVAAVLLLVAQLLLLSRIAGLGLARLFTALFPGGGSGLAAFLVGLSVTHWLRDSVPPPVLAAVVVLVSSSAALAVLLVLDPRLTSRLLVRKGAKLRRTSPPDATAPLDESRSLG